LTPRSSGTNDVSLRAAHFFQLRHAPGRLVLALALGGGSGLLLSLRYPVALAATGGWDVGALTLLGLAWHTIVRSDAAATRSRAAEEDPGRKTVYGLTLVTSAISLLAATILVAGAKGISTAASRELIALCLLTVAASWTLTHTAFALRYAHLYYHHASDGSGVEFPGGKPATYFDFAYLAFTIGMTFQVSDTAISSAAIRRAALLHAAISFAYNTAILAFVLNLVFGFVSTG
jgi:uncharacterized membrane protein